MKAFFRSLTIKVKLLIIILAILFSLIINQLMSLNELWSDLNKTKMDELQRLTEVAYSIMVEQNALVQDGSQTLEQAKANAKKLIAGLRYGDNEYFFMFNNEYYMPMHPIKPELETKNLINLADTNGKLFFKELVDEAVKKGESYTDYYWPKPGSKEAVEKKSYGKYYTQWQMGVATGVYINDLNDIFWHEVWIASRTSIIILMITLFLVSQTAKSIISPLDALERKMRAVAEKKDLTIRAKLKGKDELAAMGHAFDAMLDSFHQILHEMSTAAQQVASASTELSTTTQQTLAGMESQSDETQQVSSAMTEMSATVHEVASNISEAATASHGASTATEKGKSIVAEAHHSVQELVRKLEEAESLTHTLEQQSAAITSIVAVITGIAEQTNLLALNAAIEAARAGEQGRGFAVVADEVRSLSSRTHESTNEIHEVINKLQADSKAAVRAMTESKQAADIVESQASKTDHALVDITQAVEQIDLMTSQIASASEQQSLVAEEINRNIINISAISEQSAAGGEQTARASEELAHLSEEMRELVQQFKL